MGLNRRNCDFASANAAFAGCACTKLGILEFYLPALAAWLDENVTAGKLFSGVAVPES